MRSHWTYGANALPQFRRGHLYLIDEPAWLALAGWFIDQAGRGCCLFHWIKLPAWLHITDKDGRRWSWAEWWGDLGQVWHAKIFCPLFYWHDGHPRRKQITVEIGYDRLKEVLGAYDPEYFKDCED